MQVGPASQRAVVTICGALCALVLVELGLRLFGFAFLEHQERRNRAATAAAEGRVILCIGESTTAFGGDDSWTSQLEQVLEQRDPGQSYTVLNAAIPGTDTSVLVSQLEHNLDRYAPDVVVAMMGANDTDQGAIPALDGPRVEQTGALESLRTVRLVRQLLHSEAEASTRGQTPGVAPAAGEYHALVRQGRDLVEEFRFAEAEDVLTRARDLNPRHEAAFVELGVLHETVGRTEEAEEMFVEAARLCPPCEAPLLELARHHERLENSQRAVDTFRHALELRPDSPNAWFGLGRSLRNLEEFEEAASAFERVIELQPKNGEAHVSLGLCLEGTGELDRAEEMLVEGWKRNRDRRSFIRLADHYERRDMHEDMLRLIEDATASRRDEDDILGRASLYHHRRGDTAEATRYRKAADEARRRAIPPMTLANYQHTKQLLDVSEGSLVAVQYPLRSLEPLRATFAEVDGVPMVDNEASFRDALAEHPYDALFWDNCYGDFGHLTRAGNRILAENVAEVILGQVYSKPGG